MIVGVYELLVRTRVYTAVNDCQRCTRMYNGMQTTSWGHMHGMLQASMVYLAYYLPGTAVTAVVVL